MLIQDAIHSVRRACALRHLSFSTEKTYTHWLGRYGLFLKASHTTCRGPIRAPGSRFAGAVMRATLSGPQERPAAAAAWMGSPLIICVIAYATHALHGGAFVRDLQVVLGHNHLETTML